MEVRHVLTFLNKNGNPIRNTVRPTPDEADACAERILTEIGLMPGVSSYGCLGGAAYPNRYAARVQPGQYRWTPAELLNQKVPPPRWELPIQRGRPSTAMLQLAQQWAN